MSTSVFTYFDDNEKMAHYGRICAKNKAIRDSRESIRNLAVAIGNADNGKSLSAMQTQMNDAISELIEAIETKIEDI